MHAAASQAGDDEEVVVHGHIVIGSGVFGSSTALALSRLGHSVTVLDRSASGYCAPDAASNDLNKIVRADYKDEHYARLAKMAIELWRRDDRLRQCYHEVGLLLHSGASNPDGQVYVKKGLSTALRDAHQEQGSSSSSERVHPSSATVESGKTTGSVGTSMPAPLPRLAYELTSEEQTSSVFAADLQLGVGLKGIGKTQQAYINPRAGWAEAQKATNIVLDQAKELGARVLSNANVVELLHDDQLRFYGARLQDGRVVRTSNCDAHVICCVGSWSTKFLHSALPPKIQRPPSTSSAQCVLLLRVKNAQLRRQMKGIPVVLNFDTGFYAFEPNDEGLLKCAIHGQGHAYPEPPCAPQSSYPNFAQGQQSDAADSSSERAPNTFLPADKQEKMLKELYGLYPELADPDNAQVVQSRICWYSDSVDEEWLIDYVPGTRALVVCCADSGHAFKFLPLLGSLVTSRMQLTDKPLTPHQSKVWSFAHHLQAVAAHRTDLNIRGQI
ncbi:FAD-dependent oxidoreductase [Ceraceosorus bombacis]|uniref:FAD-dependent oxidoreductase n=1 Tax=Ceraceosorus bombacis TaxID=401625 RepID=A0A0N7L9K7_9BASI|nr:FAD-dependent oxidoreductase [Ceraceosorus bombacis]